VNLALERLLQCGSKKYAVRDLLSQASMRSFSKLTANQTTDQYLMFTFNSPILKDFSNLLNVYCSMLFDPLLRREDYQEVVRRFTFENERLGFSGELAGELFDGQFQLDQTVYSLIGEELLGNDNQGLCKALDLANLSFDDVLQHYRQTVTLPNCTLILHGDINPHYFAEQFDRNIE
jgi:Zn-dependent M16 (insulinase) family peptidase